MYKRPEQKAAAIHGTKLRGPKGPVGVMDEPMNPPKATANAPIYGPSIIPINGAMIAVTLIDVLMAPITGNRDQREKIAHKDAKTQTSAKFFAATLEFNAFSLTFPQPIRLQFPCNPLRALRVSGNIIWSVRSTSVLQGFLSRVIG
ncbi:MAG: hypothetical protein JSV85_05920 [Candidatus Bathyarchaeota archaeon]|nr:MAG: hypothetical protein JSV85_05920 [Candidatus Bathyarchaeota archaeon]